MFGKSGRLLERRGELELDLPTAELSRGIRCRPLQAVAGRRGKEEVAAALSSVLLREGSRSLLCVCVCGGLPSRAEQR